VEELAGRPEAGAALEVAALLRRTWAGARASEAEVRSAHVPIGGSAAHACGWRSACLCACGQRRDAHHRAAIGGRKHLAVGRPGGPGERAGSMPCAAPATPTTERRCGGAALPADDPRYGPQRTAALAATAIATWAQSAQQPPAPAPVPAPSPSPSPSPDVEGATFSGA